MSIQYIVSGEIKEIHIRNKIFLYTNLGLKFSLIIFITKWDVVKINIV